MRRPNNEECRKECLERDALWEQYLTTTITHFKSSAVELTLILWLWLQIVCKGHSSGVSHFSDPWTSQIYFSDRSLAIYNFGPVNDQVCSPHLWAMSRDHQYALQSNFQFPEIHGITFLVLGLALGYLDSCRAILPTPPLHHSSRDDTRTPPQVLSKTLEDPPIPAPVRRDRDGTTRCH